MRPGNAADNDEEERPIVTGAQMHAPAEVVLRVTREEVEALDALRAGVSALAERDVDLESAVVAALELALVRLAEDFELPETEDGTVRRGLDAMRASWSRGNACL
jgi:hypothetical protein